MSVAKRLPLASPPAARDDSQGMDSFRFPVGEIGQESFLMEVFRHAILLPLMAAQSFLFSSVELDHYWHSRDQ